MSDEFDGFPDAKVSQKDVVMLVLENLESEVVRVQYVDQTIISEEASRILSLSRLRVSCSNQV
jgi:hypothetical protein